MVIEQNVVVGLVWLTLVVSNCPVRSPSESRLTFIINDQTRLLIVERANGYAESACLG